MLDPMAFLAGVAQDPLAFSILLFLFAVAAAVFLPIPVEAGLLFSTIHWSLLAIVIGAGKALGSVLVFRIGARVEEQINRWIARFPQGRPWLARLEGFIARRGYVALFILLSIPFMSDTIVLYLFSILNPSVVESAAGAKEVPGTAATAASGSAPASIAGAHAMKLLPFVLVNFGAGILRSIFFLLLIGHIKLA